MSLEVVSQERQRQAPRRRDAVGFIAVLETVVGHRKTVGQEQELDARARVFDDDAFVSEHLKHVELNRGVERGPTQDELASGFDDAEGFVRLPARDQIGIDTRAPDTLGRRVQRLVNSDTGVHGRMTITA